jgi:CheY-like chemotaxis protein
VLAAIKGDPELADIPVILVSIVDEKQRGFTLGATDYLVKPVDRKRLAAVLRTVCGRDSGKLLIVEDDESSRALLRAAVEREGWSVTDAANGRIGLERLEEAKPDGILLDLMMPEMDGFEFVNRLRARDEWREIPVIVVSALDLSPEDKIRLSGKVAAVIHKSGQNTDRLLRDVSDTIALFVGYQPHEGSEAAGKLAR